MPTRLFDTYVAVDWSAARTPVVGANSIWYAVAAWQGPSLEVEPPVNMPTRAAAREAVLALLRAEVARDRRVLVGCDFPYGYPAGFAAALGLAGPPWRATWDALAGLVVDGADNANNRFAAAAALNARITGTGHPFWACPPGDVRPTLARGKSRQHTYATGLAEFRVTERMIRGARPSSPWKLSYPGSVGGQALVGIPVVRAWREDPGLAPRSLVWPFETGLRPLAPGAWRVIHAEIYPSTLRLPDVGGWVKDALQVDTLVRAFADLDARGELAMRFGPPPGLREEDRRRAEAEEGWVLAP